MAVCNRVAIVLSAALAPPLVVVVVVVTAPPHAVPSLGINPEIDHSSRESFFTSRRNAS